jgi:hypothetical protein
VRQHFTSDIRFPRYAFSNVVPEREQVNLGFLVTPSLDPFLTRAQARRVSAFTLDLYREMDAGVTPDIDPRLPPPRLVPPKHRGRPSKSTKVLVERWRT